MKNKKHEEIEVLTDFEHIRLRPGMYVGSIQPTDEKVLLIKNDKISQQTKSISVGMYRLFDEILDNSVDEHKRCVQTLKKGITVFVEVDTKTNKISIKDTGRGFYNGLGINKKSNLTNIESAFTLMRAGSNFRNTEESATVAGMNGIGSSAVNMLSEHFDVTTKVENVYACYAWKKFEKIQEEQIPLNDSFGTKISFIPDREIFNTNKWDISILLSKIALKSFAVNHGLEDDDPSRIKVTLSVDGKNIPISEDIFPNDRVIINAKKGTIAIWESDQSTTSFSMVNGSICTGIHQKIAQELFNTEFDYQKAHEFYDFFISIDIPTTLMRFGDQSKTKFNGARYEIEPLIVQEFAQKIKNSFTKTELFGSIKGKISEKLELENLKKLRASKRNAKTKISNKYFPPSKRSTNLFICEGLSALGGLSQKRNVETDGIYALRGKIKNVKSVEQLTSNSEIVDIINILDLEYGSDNKKCKYERVIIATDFDPDGAGHICSLIVQFFSKWFPYVIEQGRLYHLQTPLVGCNIPSRKSRRYFQSMEDFKEYSLKNQVKNVSYYKGLGSYGQDDWEWIFTNMHLHRFTYDTRASQFLNIAFGDDADKRKKWLEL